MTVTIRETTDHEQWNTFLEGQPSASIQQSYQWGDLVKLLGDRIYRLAAFDDERICGIMLISVVPLPLPVSVPGVHLNWLYTVRGPIVERPDSPALPALIEYAHQIGKREHAVMLRLDPNIGDDDPDQNVWLAAFHHLGFQSNTISGGPGRRAWMLDISPSAEKLLADCKMTWRQNIRVSERKGVTIREGTTQADFDTFYELFKITSERDDFFIHEKEYVKEVLDQFARHGDGVLLLAEHEGELLAGKILLRLGYRCWDMFGASSNNKRNLKATYLLQYRAFLWAKSKGCTSFDFRAIPEILEPGEEMWGVYEFKKGFGGYSRLLLPSQDYVYRPALYYSWRKIVGIRRERRRKERQRVEMERAARGKVEQKATPEKTEQTEKATP